MRSLLAAVAVLPLSLPLVACSLLHKSGATDAGVDAGAASAVDAGTANAAPPPAENVNEIARFPDETSMNDAPAKVADGKGLARNSVPSGTLVATLPMGASVVEIAQHDNFILCSFTDPKTPSRTLEGWISASTFVAGPNPAPSHGCGAGKTMLVVDDQDFCGKTCKTDKDCAAGQTCSGKANLLEGGKPGPEADTCTVPTPGTTPAAPTSQTIIGVQQPPLPNGTCAPKYVLASDKLCHFDCSKSPMQCPPKSRCTAKLTSAKQPVCEEAP